MSLEHNPVLRRYHEAASTIVKSSSAVGPADEDAAASHGDAQASYKVEDLESSEAAMMQLLSRQAKRLLHMHRALVAGSAESSEVNDELLRTRLEDLATIAMSKFYSYRHDLLPYVWRQLYTDTLILTTHHEILRSMSRDGRLGEEALDIMVEKLDRALITAGGAGVLGRPWIEHTLKMLESMWLADLSDEPPRKRQRRETQTEHWFPTEEPLGRPTISPGRECPRYENWTLQRFEDYMNEGKGEPLPVVFTDLTRHWPALTDHPWRNPEHLLSRTFGGRRLVPIEVGRSYVDEDWGQELIQFKTFLTRYIDPTMGGDEPSSKQPKQIGYLAQHNLFQQIPSLRNDIQVPDFCWADVPPHPTDPSKNQHHVDAPRLNAWLGPAGTITPLHTDGYHNLFCQVVGTKYVRLYPPQATAQLRPRPPERGVDMSNTSAVDVGVMEGWDPAPPDADLEDMEKLKEDLEGAGYWECVLTPGDALVVPIGWWHYVRSLSVSFSVSFWWN